MQINKIKKVATQLNSHANTTKDYNNNEVKRKYLFTSANCDSNILTVSSARGGEHEQLSHHILSIQPYFSQLSFGHEVHLSHKNSAVSRNFWQLGLSDKQYYS